MMEDGSIILWLLLAVWSFMPLYRIARGVEAIGDELKRLRQIAEGRR
jgi:hypothetical protein